MSDQHQLTLLRQNEGLFAIITVDLSHDVLNNVVDKDTLVMTYLMNALTAWRDYTREGMEAWSASSEDFNVGDLACYEGDATLVKYLNEHYINAIEVATYNVGTSQLAYDKVLMRERLGDQETIQKINVTLEWLDEGDYFVEANDEGIGKMSISETVDPTCVSNNMAKVMVSFQELNFTVADVLYSNVDGNNISIGGYNFTRLMQG